MTTRNRNYEKRSERRKVLTTTETDERPVIWFSAPEVTPELADNIRNYLEANGLKITHPYGWASGLRDIWDHKDYDRYQLENADTYTLASPEDWAGLKIVMGIDPHNYISEVVFEDLEEYLEIEEYEED